MPDYHVGQLVWFRVGRPFRGDEFRHPAVCGYGKLWLLVPGVTWHVHGLFQTEPGVVYLVKQEDLYRASWTFHGPVIDEHQTYRRY